MEDERNEGFATLEFFPPMDGKKTVCAFSSWGLTCCSFHSTRLCKYIIPDSLSAYFCGVQNISEYCNLIPDTLCTLNLCVWILIWICLFNIQIDLFHKLPLSGIICRKKWEPRNLVSRPFFCQNVKVGTTANENSWTSTVRFSKSSHICLSFYQTNRTFSIPPLLFYCRINSCQKNIQTIYHLKQIPVSFRKIFLWHTFISNRWQMRK